VAVEFRSSGTLAVPVAAPLVDVLLQVLDPVQVDLADRHEAADAVDVHRQPAVVGGGDAGLDELALGDAVPVGVDGRPPAREQQHAVGVEALDVDLNFSRG
jgi:hypothetical protein